MILQHRQEKLAGIKEREQISEYYGRISGDCFRCKECGAPILTPKGWCGECCNKVADDFLILSWKLELDADGEM